MQGATKIAGFRCCASLSVWHWAWSHCSPILLKMRRRSCMTVDGVPEEIHLASEGDEHQAGGKGGVAVRVIPRKAMSPSACRANQLNA
ncbi:hypothetical protein [Marinobacter sp. SS8-8]|uniref:hypothetical protein n=1 Tax=Marinobacter sp. SS8-8 TaxID=3050452 RepID=UPI0026E0E8EC|nr:hypothetical protein [Marinobacter sp. SS8-8]